MDWDSPHSQDVVLRKKCESGEEVAVSALLGPRTYGEEDEEDKESIFPREALMKVCIKKPGLSSILQFDCGVSGSNVGDWSSVYINGLHYLPSTSLDCSIYKSPSYRHELDFLSVIVACTNFNCLNFILPLFMLPISKYISAFI